MTPGAPVMLVTSPNFREAIQARPKSVMMPGLLPLLLQKLPAYAKPLEPKWGATV
jgi:hypothetical protein